MTYVLIGLALAACILVVLWLAGRRSQAYYDYYDDCPPNCIKCGLCAKCDADIYYDGSCNHVIEEQQ